MKKLSFLMLFLLAVATLPALGQESRQDISVSGSAIMAPFAAGNAVQLHSTVGYGPGGLVSYRYDLTPHGALELNYQYNQNVQHFIFPSGNYTVHDKIQEISGAYVYSFNYKNWNPFLELGVAGLMFSPIDDHKTSYQNLTRNTNISALWGVGFAYEISPSFDIRAEFRNLVTKTPSFNFPANATRAGVYYNIYDPTIGIAYHF
jgi:outer membrane immunogenic protein